MKSTIAFDLTGLYDLGDPVPTPLGWTTAIFGQADPSLNGIYEGQTVGGEGAELLPLVKLADLPTENGVIVTEYLSYDMDTLMAPGEGGWIIAQATDATDAGGIGDFGELPGDGWSVVYGSQYWLDAIAAATDFAPATRTVGTGLSTTGTVNLDMASVHGTIQTITATGDITFTTSNRAAGREVTLVIAAGGSSRTLAWPSWLAVGAALPTTLASGKTLAVTVTFTSTTEASGIAAAAAQP